jgi:hypothetical protein
MVGPFQVVGVAFRHGGPARPGLSSAQSQTAGGKLGSGFYPLR